MMTKKGCQNFRVLSVSYATCSSLLPLIVRQTNRVEYKNMQNHKNINLN